MKNVTLSAEEQLIETARETAKAQKTTLNQAFRDWLADYVRPVKTPDKYETLMRSIEESGARAGHKFTREEMNAR